MQIDASIVTLHDQIHITPHLPTSNVGMTNMHHGEEKYNIPPRETYTLKKEMFCLSSCHW